MRMATAVWMRHMGWSVVGVLLGTLGALPAFAEPDREPTFTPEQVEFFQKQVEPILKARCFKCHGGEDRLRGNLRLTTRAGVLKGGDLGPVVSLDKPAESVLLKAIRYDELKMPPSGQLPAGEIEILTQWVKEGLPVSPERMGVAEAQPQEGESRPNPRDYWAYRPVAPPPVPEVRRTDWVKNPIDAYLLAKLEAAGLEPNPPASPVELVRRLAYDLTGLPPNPADVDRYLAAANGPQAEEAWRALVDQLLDSPQYGEKWGRHWLDLVRFAETHGYERDSAKPFAWRYRDYVINALNADKPYQQFLVEQLAGDELENPSTEALIATGYYRLGIWDDEPADRLLAKYDVLDGIVSTTGQVMLGLSIGCARCHDHKKDPLPQADYYRLLAYFRDVSDMNVGNLRRVVLDQDQKERAALQLAHRRDEQQVYRELQDWRHKFAGALARERGLEVTGRSQDLTGLRFRFYRDTFEQLPDFEPLKPEEQGELPEGRPTLAVASRAEAIGIVFEGTLQAPQTGAYEFQFQATEGARLVVGSHTVFERRKKGKHKGEGRMQLEAGEHPFRLEYFNTVAEPVLKLSWSGPGFETRSLTEGAPGRGPLVADSRAKAQEWKFTTQTPAADWNQPAFDDAGWKAAPGGFGVRGTPGSHVRTEWKSNEIWLRKKFEVGVVPARLALTLHHDEDAQIYLNGELLHEAPGFATDYQTIILPTSASSRLRVGENVLAVRCRQTGGGQYIDVGLEEAPAAAVLDALLAEHGPALLGEGFAKVQALQQRLTELKQTKLPEPGIEVMCVEERGREPTHVLLRGNPQAVGDKVEPAPPGVACGPEPVAIEERPGGGSSGKRLALARWITHPDNPLTWRVMANRLWQHHFGRGIVATPNDFGQLGEPPTHPELLDWLARQFVERGGSLKAMHRLILTSNAWRMSSSGSPTGLARDAGNNLFWRFNMRRLSAEEVRDSILATTGSLRLEAGGPGVYPRIPAEVLAGQSVPGSGWGKSPPEQANRRSVYVHVKRSLLVPILSQHDQADTDSSCPVRFTTTVPTQALGMLNGEFTNEQAALFAERLEREHPGDLARQVAAALRLTTSRLAAEPEVRRDVEFVTRLREREGLSAAAALRAYCLVLLGSNEFAYLD